MDSYTQSLSFFAKFIQLYNYIIIRRILRVKIHTKSYFIKNFRKRQIGSGHKSRTCSGSEAPTQAAALICGCDVRQATDMATGTFPSAPTTLTTSALRVFSSVFRISSKMAQYRPITYRSSPMLSM